jgi:diguanylate cyclase (GGDEF)-like protein/PAS domain S-box-containing protein
MSHSETELYPLTTMFELFPIGTYRSSHDGRMIRANPALVKLNGYDSEDELLLNFNDVASQWYVDPLRRQEFMTCVERDGHVLDFLSEIYRHKTRERIWVKENAHVLRAPNGKPLFYEGTVEDITEHRRMQHELKTLAFNDALTNLPNRRLLIDRLQHAMHGCKRHNNHGALLFLDLNNFKTLNDTHGHDVGDQLLIEVARRLRQATRGTDTVARLGGDEFVVLLEDLGGDASKAKHYAASAAKKITQLLTREYVLSTTSHHSSASIGVSVFSGTAISPEQVMKDADAAMYKEKRRRVR